MSSTTTIEALAAEFAALDEEANGCCLHIVVSDFNVADMHLDSCLRDAEEAGHEDCARLARQFKELIPEEHRAAFLGVRLDDGWTRQITPWRPTCEA